MEEQLQFIGKHFTEIIIGASSCFMLLFKYREAISFGVRICKVIYKPLIGIGHYILLPQKLRNQQIIDAERTTKIGSTLDDLSSLIKQKLSYNGGSSLVDAIRRIEHRQIVLEHSQRALLLEGEHGHFCCDLSGRNKWVNRTYARFLGCGVDELKNFGWKRFIRSDELARYNKIWQSAFADACDFDEVVTFTNVNNNTVRLKISASVILDEKGNALEYIGTVVAL